MRGTVLLVLLPIACTAVEMQLRDIRLAVDELHYSFTPTFGPLADSTHQDAQVASDLNLFTRWDQAWGITASTSNGLLDDHGGLTWRMAASARYWSRKVNGRDVNKTDSLTDPNAYVLTGGLRAHVGWAWPISEELHVEVLPYLGLGMTQLSFPLWSEEVPTTSVVSYWTQPTGNGWYWETGLRCEFQATLPNRWQLGLACEYGIMQMHSSVNGWIYYDPSRSLYVTDEAQVDLSVHGWATGISVGRRF